MTNSEYCYKYETNPNHPGGTSYYFVSEGNRLLIKVVEYNFIGVIQQRFTYNLGFGTFNLDCRQIDDNDISTNGDAYKVFNTVLHTIPDFLQRHPQSMVMVASVDSQTSFAETCRQQCRKECTSPDCRNMHRRINIYKGFLNKHYTVLSEEYFFYGGINYLRGRHTLEEYRIDNHYDEIFFCRK